jgi:BspA type Leucine rich repeat region (6 copies)
MASTEQGRHFALPGLRFAGIVGPLLLLLLVLPCSVEAQFTYTTNADGITLTVTGYTGPGGAVAIPGTNNGMTVTAIGNHAFKTNNSLTSVTIPNGITNIGSFAFDDCASLISVTIPGSVTSYGLPGFYYCTKLAGVYFQGNAPEDDSPYTSPVFEGDNNATLYYLQGTTGWSSTFDLLPTVLWNPQVIAQLIYTTNNGSITITADNGAGGVVVIPSTIDGLPVTSIGESSFSNSPGLAGITIPNTVGSIEDDAFFFCTNLTNVTIPGSVTNIGNYAFALCSGLTSFTIPDRVASLGDDAFFFCTNLTSISIPGSVTNIGGWAFQDCYNLNGVYFQGNAPVADSTVFNGDNNVIIYYLPETGGWGATFAGLPTVPILFTYETNGGAITLVKYIGIWGSVVIPGSINGLPVTGIGNSAFDNCPSLTNIVVGSNITSIAGQAFVGCPNLLSINVDALNPVYSSVNGVLFDKNQVTLLYYPGGRAGSYTIPDGVTSIPSYAFQSCPNLTSLTVPASVSVIEPLAFNVDTSLMALYFEGNAPTVDSFAFYNIQNTVTVFYLQATTGWDATLGGLRIAPWLPQMQTSDGGFGVQSNQFGFNITWASGQAVVVEACTNLASPVWIPVTTNTLTGGTFYFSDAQWTNFPGRFYRLQMP